MSKRYRVVRSMLVREVCEYVVDDVPDDFPEDELVSGYPSPELDELILNHDPDVSTYEGVDDDDLYIEIEEVA